MYGADVLLKQSSALFFNYFISVVSFLNLLVDEATVKHASSVICTQFDLHPGLLGRFSEESEWQGEFTSASGFTAFSFYVRFHLIRITLVFIGRKFWDGQRPTTYSVLW